MSRHELYDEDGNVENDPCPRCEHAYLADHGDRLSCGGCGYTEWQ